jgi:hypothetical protein
MSKPPGAMLFLMAAMARLTIAQEAGVTGMRSVG